MALFKSILVGLALCGVIHATEAPRELTGSWRLNHELSDDAREKLGAAMKARRNDPDAGAARSRGGFRKMWEARKRVKEMEQGMQSLSIVETEGGLRLRNGNDRVREIVPDGAVRNREGGFGGVDFRAAWEGDRLVVHEVQEQGARVKREYYRVRNDEHLYIDVTIAGQGDEVRYRSVYDRVK